MDLRLLPIIACLALAACGGIGPDRIDGASAERYDASIAELRSGLPEAERARFDVSLGVIEASALVQSDSRAEMEARLRTDLNGKTAGEVITEADTRRRDVTNAAMDSMFKFKKQMKAQIEDMESEAR